MVLAVEPMVTAGRHMVRMGDDGWAIYSQDGSLAAHFEFTIAITADGPRILTPWHEAKAAWRPDADVRRRWGARAAGVERSGGAERRRHGAKRIARSCRRPRTLQGHAPGSAFARDGSGSAPPAPT